MKKHRFSLILSGVSEITADLADALYEATRGDIEFNLCSGIAFLEFERASPSLREAVVSAIRDVEGARTGICVSRVDRGESA
jgi:hypothetical protein